MEDLTSVPGAFAEDWVVLVVQALVVVGVWDYQVDGEAPAPLLSLSG